MAKNFFTAYLETLLEVVFPKKRYSALAQEQGVVAITRRVRPLYTKGHLTLLSYGDSAVRHFLYAIKYERHQESIIVAADILRAYICDEIQEEAAIHAMYYVLCTIPITQERKMANGYDHLHTIFDAFYRGTSHTDPPIQDGRDLLVWTRQVRRQSRLKRRSERLENVGGAMTVAKPIPPHTICFVVDDITTTGATLAEARRALIAGGAHSVITLALAH